MARRQSNRTVRREALQAVYNSLRALAVGFGTTREVSTAQVSTWCAGMKDLAETAEILERIELTEAATEATDATH